MKENGQNRPYGFRKFAVPAAPAAAAGGDKVKSVHSTAMAQLVSRNALDLVNGQISLECLTPSPAQFIFELSFATTAEFMPLV